MDPRSPSSPKSGDAGDSSLTPEQQYPDVRPELARILAELDRQNEEILARMEREALERERRPGLMGRLFGLETHVIA